MNKTELTAREMDFIKAREEDIANLLNVLNNLKDFKLGDYLIAYNINRWDRSINRAINSYGALKKFKVVYVDINGLPYIKELDKTGRVRGDVINILSIVNVMIRQDIKFELDPHYIDATILANEESYDAVAANKQASDLFKDVSKYNKSIKMKFNDEKVLLAFLQGLKVGDILWRSAKTYILINQLDSIPTTHNGSRVDKTKVFGNALTMSGKTLKLTGKFFANSAIYTGKPRSYKELQDLK